MHYSRFSGKVLFGRLIHILKEDDVEAKKGRRKPAVHGIY
jgi:hypothetical protein